MLIDDIVDVDDVMPKEPYTPSRTVYQLTWDDELRQLKKPEWLIENVLPATGLGILYGEPGCGKTFLALDWAFSVAHGLPWLGHKSQQGEVVYVCSEGWLGVRERVTAWKEAHGLTDNDRSGVAFLGRSIRLYDPADVEHFGDAIAELGSIPSLIVIDTLARNAAGLEENSAKDMGQVISMCDSLRARFACAVLLVHHSSKNPERRTPRGSSVLTGAADVIVGLTRDEHGYITIFCEKQKDTAPFRKRTVRMVPVKNSVILELSGVDPLSRTTYERKPLSGDNRTARPEPESDELPF